MILHLSLSGAQVGQVPVKSNCAWLTQRSQFAPAHFLRVSVLRLSSEFFVPSTAQYWTINRIPRVSDQLPEA